MQVDSVHYSKVLIHVHVLSCIISCPINKTLQNGNCIHLLSFNTMCQAFRYYWFSWQWKVLSHFVSLIKLWLIISWTVFKFLHFLTIYNYTSIRTDFFSRLVKVQFKKVMIWLLLYHYAFVFFLNRSLLSWRRESLSMKMMTRKKTKEGKKRKQAPGNTLH